MAKNSHTEELARQLRLAASQIEMAAEDAEDGEFHGAVAHAEIALSKLKEIVANGRAADRSRYEDDPSASEIASMSGGADPLFGQRIDSADMGEC